MIRRLIILLLIVGCEEVLEPEDCAGVAGGTAVEDDCGVCDGIDGYVAGSCYDCADVPFGTAQYDNCDVCDTDLSNDCIQDCNDIWGGDAEMDECGVCGGDNSTCNISYSTTILPIINSNCTGCHGGSGGLSLSTHTSLIIGGNSGAVVTPGDGSGSRLVKKLRGTASEDRMPKGGVFWNDTDINLIETWINEGALNN